MAEALQIYHSLQDKQFSPDLRALKTKMTSSRRKYLRRLQHRQISSLMGELYMFLERTCNLDALTEPMSLPQIVHPAPKRSVGTQTEAPPCLSGTAQHSSSNISSSISVWEDLISTLHLQPNSTSIVVVPDV
ncbi:hypothetical protein Baya_0126 [Bagarius yarrelli]|uniref:Uncharacterized protein n=1 Tax=Bagarius yarrelli TaxID=175774 RepID=A0A556THE3_BAGYA|nr:hypothetical protein Baya_0126 [Bagarius yarrelli]